MSWLKTTKTVTRKSFNLPSASFFRAFILSIVILLVSFSTQIVFAKNKVLHLTWAHVYEQSEPLHKWALWAANEINVKSNGRFYIDVFPASIMGKEAELNQSLTLGIVDIINTGTSFAGQNYPPMALSELPYVFRTYEHWRAFNESALFDEIKQGYLEKTRGNRVLGNSYYGQRHITSNKPIRNPSDMINLKLRVPNASIYKMFPLAVGANPSPISFSETYLALQQGVVDAQENPLPTIKAKKFYEVQTHISLTGHLQGSVLTVVGDSLWSRLSRQDKILFSETLKQAAENISSDTRKAELALVAWFKQQGIIVLNVDRSEFRKMVLPSHKEVKQRLGEDLYDRLQNIK